MNECPTCGRKIKGETCPYCDEELMQEGSADSTPVSVESLVVVYRCDEQWQAEFVMSALESEGIPAFRETSDDIDGLGYQDMTGDAIGDTAIMVEEEDVGRAREIIKVSEHDLDAGEH
jgi:hypothetical protein